MLITSLEGEDLKNLKRGGSMVQGQVFLKEGEASTFAVWYLIFSRFIIFTF